MLADHPNDPRLGPLCTALVTTIDADSEAFLRGVLARGTEAGVKGRACTSLAHNLKYRARLVRQLKDEKDALKPWEEAWGKPAVAHLFKHGRRPRQGEHPRLRAPGQGLRRKVKHPTHGDLGRFAKAHLLSLREPVEEGQPAPEISGADLDGKAMKLSDFKGQGGAAGLRGARAADLPGELRRAAELSDAAEGQAVRAAGRERRTPTGPRRRRRWRRRSWRTAPGSTAAGPTGRWRRGGRSTRWPTLVLIDAKGVVREMYVRLAGAQGAGRGHRQADEGRRQEVTAGGGRQMRPRAWRST